MSEFLAHHETFEFHVKSLLNRYPHLNTEVQEIREWFVNEPEKIKEALKQLRKLEAVHISLRKLHPELFPDILTNTDMGQ